MRRFAAQFARASVWVHALAVVPRARAREVATPRAHEARREGQSVVRRRRLATPGQVVLSRAAPVAYADDCRLDFRVRHTAVLVTIIVSSVWPRNRYRRTILG
jgi:hypothetical protein